MSENHKRLSEVFGQAGQSSVAAMSAETKQAVASGDWTWTRVAGILSPLAAGLGVAGWATSDSLEKTVGAVLAGLFAASIVAVDQAIIREQRLRILQLQAQTGKVGAGEAGAPESARAR